MNYFDQLFFAKYLRESEELLYVCHKHIVLIIDDVIMLLFFGLVLPGFFYYNDSFSLQSLIPFVYFELFVLGVYCYILYKIFDWYNDVWLVTDLGIIDIDWDVFARSVEYIDYHDVKGAEIHTSSFLDSFLHKGDIEIHSHGDDDGFVLESAENPYEVVSYINEVIAESHEDEEEDEKAPLDLLLHTLTEVVREHLKENGHKKWHEADNEEKIEEVLHKKGTIDLR